LQDINCALLFVGIRLRQMDMLHVCGRGWAWPLNPTTILEGWNS